MTPIAGFILVSLLILVAGIWAIGSVALLLGINGTYVVVGMVSDLFSRVKKELFHPEKKWKYFRLLMLIVLSAIFLTGCCTPPPPVIIEKAVVVKQEIPKIHLVPCKAPEYFSKEYFLSLDPPSREERLTLLNLDFAAALRKCDLQITEIRKLNDASQ